ncbi:MAG: Holliday junction resolvase RuvX [Erysipelotrichales bacterium]|nr:Holliday junction resolvase RuvX [Erysipelotrichales bacterium]
MKAIGLDLGSKTLGIAISDPMGLIARPLETFRFKEDDYQKALERVIEIVKAENIEKIVLGLPKHMNNDIGIRGQISIDFKKNIEEYLPKVLVILIDERLSSVYVDRLMISAGLSRQKRKEKKDEQAAVLLLQNYLDTK